MSSTMKMNTRGVKEWLNEEGQKHREDGPASIWPDGDWFWYINGKMHRLTGPASNFCYGSIWWINGEPIEPEEHPFNIFRNQYKLFDNYDEWTNDMKMLFKLIYG